jgi:peptidoglycan hydrolase-like protein with peptidoglycan-binding domain
MAIDVLKPLARGDKGPAVTELQMRLAGFRGTVPDGDYGPGTELQVRAFQSLYMRQAAPSGAADEETMKAIADFGSAHPVDFAKLRCPCGQCGGFGRGLNKGRYRQPGQLELYHLYEYPGIHRMLLWTYRAAQFYGRANNWQLTTNSAYRCSIDNRNHGRQSTNHHGKAIDIDILGGAGTDRGRCNELRSILQEKAAAQLGWAARDRKALEPPHIAPTWVHLDVRCYRPAFLDDRYFVTSLDALDSAPPGTAADGPAAVAGAAVAASPEPPAAEAEAPGGAPSIDFAGPGTRLDGGDIEAAAEALGCSVAAIKAVIDVESRGGFLPDRRPRILFERHYFSRLTKGAHDSQSDISNPKWGGYTGGPAEYARLARAIALNRDAALRSASWGMFQIMGDNCGLAGFADAESFVAAMVSGEKAQLDAFVSFVRASRLADELARTDWAGFARGYNGPKYAENKYDIKLAAAYALHSAGGPRVGSPLPLLRMGDKGEFVTRLQTALGIAADGDFGPGTKAAVVAFQKKHGLYADGIVGQKTWAKLGD